MPTSHLKTNSGAPIPAEVPLKPSCGTFLGSVVVSQLFLMSFPAGGGDLGCLKPWSFVEVRRSIGGCGQKIEYVKRSRRTIERVVGERETFPVIRSPERVPSTFILGPEQQIVIARSNTVCWQGIAYDCVPFSVARDLVQLSSGGDSHFRECELR